MTFILRMSHVDQQRIAVRCISIFSRIRPPPLTPSVDKIVKYTMNDYLRNLMNSTLKISCSILNFVQLKVSSNSVPEWISEMVLRRLMQHGLVVRMIRVRNEDQRPDPIPAPLSTSRANLTIFSLWFWKSSLDAKTSLWERSYYPFWISGSHRSQYDCCRYTFDSIYYALDVDSLLHVPGESPSPIQLFRGSVQSVQAQISLGEAASFSGGGGTRTSPTFIVDYTVRVLTDVVYFRISRSLYYAARNTTLLERANPVCLLFWFGIGASIHYSCQ